MNLTNKHQKWVWLLPGQLSVQVQVDRDPEDQTSAIFQMKGRISHQIVEDLAELVLGLLRNAERAAFRRRLILLAVFVVVVVFAGRICLVGLLDAHPLGLLANAVGRVGDEGVEAERLAGVRLAEVGDQDIDELVFEAVLLEVVAYGLVLAPVLLAVATREAARVNEIEVEVGACRSNQKSTSQLYEGQ